MLILLATCACAHVFHNPQEKFAAHGYGSFFILSTMDRYYKDDMTRDEALDLLKLCIKEVQSRFIVNLNSFSVKVSLQLRHEMMSERRVSFCTVRLIGYCTARLIRLW